MPTTTTNYDLVKIALTDSPPDITVLNANFDVIDAALKANADVSLTATAGGTATAITLTLPTLVDGLTKTFVASLSNGGSATTVNSVPLYKANTTSPPTIIAGKAYTVWYSASNACFFLKASAEGDAIAANVLAGKTFSNDSDTGLVGTMTNQGAKVLTPATVNVPIPAGYHNGSGYVQGDADLVSANIKSGITLFGVAGNSNVVDTSAGDAVAADILSGKKAYVDGSLVTGNIPSKAAATITPGTANQTIAAGQYLSGVQTISGDADLVAGNILSGKEIFGVTGTLSAVKSIQKGELIITTGGFVTATISAVNIASSIIMFSVTNNYNSTIIDDCSFFRPSFDSNTQIRFTRAVAGGTVYIEWFVVEFNSAFVKSLQTGVTLIQSALYVNASINSVDTSKCLLITYSTGYGYDSGYEFAFINARGVIVSSTQLKFTRGASTGSSNYSNVGWQLIEFC